MEILRLTHLGICVADLEVSLRFYRDVLGFVETGRFRGQGDPTATVLELPQDVDLEAVYLERDGWRIELLYYRVPGALGSGDPAAMNARGLTHLSFRVDDLDAVLEQVVEYGGRVLAHTRTGTGPAAVLFVTDPDGTRVELIEAPGDPNAIPGSDG